MIVLLTACPRCRHNLSRKPLFIFPEFNPAKKEAESGEQNILQCPFCGKIIGTMSSVVVVFTACRHCHDNLSGKPLPATLEIYVNKKGFDLARQVNSSESVPEIMRLLEDYPDKQDIRLEAMIVFSCPNCKKIVGKILLEGQKKKFIRKMKKLGRQTKKYKI